MSALDLTAGTLNELIAYTGFGKSVVLVETFACWAARNGIVVSFAVPTNADVVRYAYQIQRSLALLGSDVAVTPLMSPRSVLTVAETTASRPEISRSRDAPAWDIRLSGIGSWVAGGPGMRMCSRRDRDVVAGPQRRRLEAAFVREDGAPVARELGVAIFQRPPSLRGPPQLRHVLPISLIGPAPGLRHGLRRWRQ